MYIVISILALVYFRIYTYTCIFKDSYLHLYILGFILTLIYCRTYSVDGTETKTSRAEIVGRIPNITSADEEERSGRFLRDRGRRPVNLDDIRARVFGSSSRTKKSETSDSSRRKKVVNFLKRLMAE